MSLINLGSSLSIIRFKEGLAGIQNMINSLGLNSYISIDRLVKESDNERIVNSVRCVNNTKRRWSLKQAKRSRKRGATHKSGAYSQIASVPRDMDLTCKICGGSEDSGILNKADSSISRDISVSVAWLFCSICDGWRHNQCLRVVSTGKNLKFTLEINDHPILFFLPEHCRRTIFIICICFRVFSKRIFRDMTYFVERNIGFTFLNLSQYSIPKHWLDWC